MSRVAKAKDDDPLAIPAFLQIPQKDRDKAWAKKPPRAATMVLMAKPKKGEYPAHWYEDPSFVKFLAEREQTKEAKAATRAEEVAKRKEVAKVDRELGGGKVRRAKGPAITADLPKGRVVALVKDNPRKAGSGAAIRLQTWLDGHGLTVEAVVLKGGNAKTLERAIADKIVRVATEDEIIAAPKAVEKKPKEKTDGVKAGHAEKVSRPKGGNVRGGKKETKKVAPRKRGGKGDAGKRKAKKRS